MVRIKDCKSRLPLGKEGSDWSLRQKRLQNSTEGTWLCRIVPAFCCNRQSDVEYSYTGKDRLHFPTTRGHFRKLYGHFLLLLTQYKTVHFLPYPLHLPPTQSKAFLVLSCILSPQQQPIYKVGRSKEKHEGLNK